MLSTFLVVCVCCCLPLSLSVWLSIFPVIYVFLFTFIVVCICLLFVVCISRCLHLLVCVWRCLRLLLSAVVVYVCCCQLLLSTFVVVYLCLYRLVGLVVRRPPRERKIPGSNPACTGIFSGSSHTSDLKIGTPVATLSGTWRNRVSTGTGRPGVSILWLDEVERLICIFYLCVAARKFVFADPSLRYTSMLVGC